MKRTERTTKTQSRRGVLRVVERGAPVHIVLRSGALSFCVFVAVLAWSAPAPAETLHEFLPVPSKEISGGIPEQGPHGETIHLPGPLNHPIGMTVVSGALYLDERALPNSGGHETYRIDKFNAPAGAFVAQLFEVEEEYQAGELVLHGGGVAVSRSSGEVYAGAGTILTTGTTNVNGEVAVFGESGELLRTWTGADTPAKSFDFIEDVAIDNSTNPADEGAGDLYVVDPGQKVIDAFRPEVAGIEPTKSEALTQLTGTCPVQDTICEPSEVIPFGEPVRVAVDESSGDVVVVDSKPLPAGQVEDAVDVFKPEPFGTYRFLFTLTGSRAGEPFGTVGDVAVGTSGEIYVAEQTGPVVDQFSSAGVFLGRIGDAERQTAGSR